MDQGVGKQQITKQREARQAAEITSQRAEATDRKRRGKVWVLNKEAEGGAGERRSTV